MRKYLALIIISAAALLCQGPTRSDEKFRIPVPASPREARLWSAPAPDTALLDSPWQKSSPYMSIAMFDRMREAEASAARGLAYEGLAHVYGLVMELTIYRDKWPQMRLPCAIGIGRHPAISRDAGAHTTRQNELFLKENILGAIRVPGCEMDFGGETFDWTRNTLELAPADAEGKEYRLARTLSRLTPGMLIETDAAALDLFEGAALPAFVAVSDGKGGTTVASLTPGLSGGATVEDALSKGDPQWLLFWWGESSGFLKHPWPFSFNRGGLHMAEAHAQDFKPADIPMLLIGSEPPSSLEAEKAVRLEFFGVAEGETRRMILLPLFGWRHPDVSDTASWKNGLPADVVGRCEWWARHSGKYPIAATESYGFDKATQTPIVTESFDFTDVLEGAEFLAPVPPMLALAERMGFPIKFSAELQFDELCVSPFGPAAGIPNDSEYSWLAQGLAKYALQRRVPAGPTPEEAAPVQKLLEEEGGKIAGAKTLDPWLLLLDDLSRGGCCGGYFFTRTGEECALLAQTLPLLPQESAASLAAWMKRRVETFPPQRYLNMPPFTGSENRREYWIADEYVFAPENYKPDKWYAGIGYDDTIPVPSYDRIPARELYGLWAVCAACGATPGAEDWQQCKAVLAQTVAGFDWPSLGWFLRAAELAGVDGFSPHRPYFQQYYGGVMAANSWFGGLIGFIRLARMLGDSAAEEYAWGLFAKAAALRFAQGKYPAYLYKVGALIPPVGECCKDPQGRTRVRMPDWFLQISSDGSGYLYTADWSKPEHDVRQVVAMDERGVFLFEGSAVHRHVYLAPLMHAVPELGRFLKDFLADECEAYFRRVEENFPDWNATYAEAHMGGDKAYYRFPTDAWQMFLLRAWVCGDPGPQLAARLDRPWLERGDLFYLQKLAETLMAWRGTKWE